MAVSVSRIVVSGLVAGVAYLGAQAIDLKVTGNRVDDTVTLGRMTPVPKSRARIAGTMLHLGNSLIASTVYHLFAVKLLKGPGWWRGIVFATIENSALYPLALLERFHPGVQDGQVDSYLSWTAFAQGTWRHIVFGAVLGAIPADRDRK